MDAEKEESMSISSNSLSVSEEVDKKSLPSKRKQIRRRNLYPVTVVRVPKVCFNRIQRRLAKNKPIIDLKTETNEETKCNRFILGQANGHEMDTISAESTTRLMWEMRECLQRKDYGNLARLITVFTEMPFGKMRWYPTLLKYCLIVLMYDPLVQGTGSMDMFLDGVIRCRSENDKQEFLRDISQLPSNIHVTKYNDLWTEYPLPNQLNKTTVDKLCEILNKRDIIKVEMDETMDANVSDSEWESYEENSSVEELDVTTESEKACDLDDILNNLQRKISK